MTNLPVDGFGQVPRDQRQQELEYFLNKQYNSIGLRLQSKLISIEKQFLNASNIDAFGNNQCLPVNLIQSNNNNTCNSNIQNLEINPENQ